MMESYQRLVARLPDNIGREAELQAECTAPAAKAPALGWLHA
jgi:hypothetical protein